MYEAEVYWLRGELLLQQCPAQQGEAEASLRQALAVARRRQAKSLELRAALSLDVAGNNVRIVTAYEPDPTEWDKRRAEGGRCNEVSGVWSLPYAYDYRSPVQTTGGLDCDHSRTTGSAMR